jgi:hypothetical protein
MLKHKGRPSAALVISLIALFVALGSGAYAAAKIDTSDIKKKAVTGAKINGDAIKSSKVKDGKLKGKDLKDETVSASKLGDGAVKAQKLGAITEVSDTTSATAGALGTKSVSCPAGTRVMGGGYNTDTVAVDNGSSHVGHAVESRRTNDGTGWRAKIISSGPGGPTEMTVYAYCLEDNVNGNG